MSYRRYEMFTKDGKSEMVIFGEIPVKATDFYEVYNKGKTRLDILSYEYYNDANYGWLIMQANPQYGSMEYDIPDGVTLRIPYPLSESIASYEASINYKKTLY